MNKEAVYRLFYPDKYINETKYADPNYAYIYNEQNKSIVFRIFLFYIRSEFLFMLPSTMDDADDANHGSKK